MEFYAIGMIETYGYIPAIEALDAASKSSNVKLVSVTKVGGGIVSIVFQGDVAAVKVAVDSGVAAAKRVGQVLTSHVIARLDKEVFNIALFENNVEKNIKIEQVKSVEVNISNAGEAPKAEEVLPAETNISNTEETPKAEEVLPAETNNAEETPKAEGSLLTKISNNSEIKEDEKVLVENNNQFNFFEKTDLSSEKISLENKISELKVKKNSSNKKKKKKK